MLKIGLIMGPLSKFLQVAFRSDKAILVFGLNIIVVTGRYGYKSSCSLPSDMTDSS